MDLILCSARTWHLASSKRARHSGRFRAHQLSDDPSTSTPPSYSLRLPSHRHAHACAPRATCFFFFFFFSFFLKRNGPDSSCCAALSLSLSLSLLFSSLLSLFFSEIEKTNGCHSPLFCDRRTDFPRRRRRSRTRRGKARGGDEGCVTRSDGGDGAPPGEAACGEEAPRDGHREKYGDGSSLWPLGRPP